MSDPKASRPPAFGLSSPADSGLDDELERLLADGDDAPASGASGMTALGFDKPAAAGGDDDFDFGFDSDTPVSSSAPAVDDDFDFPADLPTAEPDADADADADTDIIPPSVEPVAESDGGEQTAPLSFDDFDGDAPLPVATETAPAAQEFDDFDQPAEHGTEDAPVALHSQDSAVPQIFDEMADDGLTFTKGSATDDFAVDDFAADTPAPVSSGLPLDDFDAPAPRPQGVKGGDFDLDDEISRLVGADEAPAMLESDPFPHESGLAYGDEPQSGL